MWSGCGPQPRGAPASVPELPELEAIRHVLDERVVGQRIEQVRILRPLVLRNLIGGEPREVLTGCRIQATGRRGKFLLLALEGGLTLAVNPMLVGRLQLVPPPHPRAAKTHLIFSLSSGEELRYIDRRTMGKIYLTRAVEAIPGFGEMGPDALEVNLAEFMQRLRRHPGEIKNLLTNARFLAGIGNAYADEILHRARISPFRKRASLSTTEQEALYQAVRSVLIEGIERVREEMGQDISLKPRDWLAVHMKGGQPCPACGTPISEIRANQRITSYCRTCQPGTLIESWRR